MNRNVVPFKQPFMVLRHGMAAVADLVSLYIDFQFVQRYGKGEADERSSKDGKTIMG